MTTKYYGPNGFANVRHVKRGLNKRDQERADRDRQSDSHGDNPWTVGAATLAPSWARQAASLCASDIAATIQDGRDRFVAIPSDHRLRIVRWGAGARVTVLHRGLPVAGCRA